MEGILRNTVSRVKTKYPNINISDEDLYEVLRKTYQNGYDEGAENGYREGYSEAEMEYL